MIQLTIDPVIFQSRATGGVSRIYAEILPMICDLEPDLSIVLRLNKQNGLIKQALPMHKNIKVEEFSKLSNLSIPPRRIWNQVIKSLNYLTDYQYALYHRNHIWHSTYFTLPPRGWFGKQLTTVYDMNYELLPQYADEEFSYVRKLKAEAVKRADIVNCISETVSQDVIAYYKLDPSIVFTTALGYNSKIFQYKPDAQLDSRVSGLGDFIIYVGGRGPHKNFDGLLKTYSNWKMRSEIKLVVVGEALNLKEKHMLSDLNIHDKVQVLLDVDDNLLVKLYSRAKALVYPSHYEGFGIPLLEAMACGCPIVASRIPSSVEIASQIPFYFELNNQESFLLALDLALATGDEKSRDSWKEQAKLFSWDRTADLTLQIYKKLL